MAKVRIIWADACMCIQYLAAGSSFALLPDARKGDGTDGIHMLFCLGGRMQVRTSFKGRLSEPLVPEGCCSLYYNPGGCRLEYAGQNATEGLSVIIDRRRFLNLIAEQGSCRELQTLAEEAPPDQRIMRVTPEMQTIIHQMIQQPIQTSGGNHLFYLAKILELVCALTPSDNCGRAEVLSRMDHRIVQEAMACLEAGMDNPPSVIELAGRVGVSVSKFKQLFPRACGMTPYGYLRKLRMEKAILLLEKGEMNVTEVAYDVGYESISHFSKLFYKYHGIKPSQVRRGAVFQDWDELVKSD